MAFKSRCFHWNAGSGGLNVEQEAEKLELVDVDMEVVGVGVYFLFGGSPLFVSRKLIAIGNNHLFV